MFYFKNKYDPSFNRERKPIPGLSKYWRYSTLDSQNNNNLYPINNTPTIPNINNNINPNSPNDITIEVSYDNFYVLGVDMMKKKKYAEELKAQIEEKKYLKKLEEEKRKLDEINDDIRIEKERQLIEQRRQQNDRKYIPKINLTPLPKIEPVKVLTPRVPIPPKILPRHKTPVKTKYIYLKRRSNEEDINNYLRNRERNLERFNTDINEQINGIKNDFNSGMKKLNDEISKINYRIDDKNQRINDLIYKIKKSRPHKNDNVEVEHIYSIIRKNKDGKFSIQQFLNNNDITKFPFNLNMLNYANDGDKFVEVQRINDIINLPYINLSHHIEY